MKVLFWTSSFWPQFGGMQTQGLALVSALQKRGHDCVVITQLNLKSLPAYEEYQSIPIYRYGFNQAHAKKDIKAIGAIFRDIRNLINQFKPDVVHMNAGFNGHLSLYYMISKIISIPCLLTIHGLAADINAGFEGIFNDAFSIGELISCVSKSTLEEVRHLGPDISNKLICIPNGLPEPTLQPNALNFKPAVFLCFGRLVKDKGFDLAIRAAHLLLKRGRPFKLVIAGIGQEHENLKNLTQALGLEKTVTFLGKIEQSDIFKQINASTVILTPSRYEPFGLSALEAMQMARPVIAARSGGLTEIIRHQETGLLTPSENVEALACAMEHLLQHPRLASEMGQRAREDVLSRFSIDKMASAYEQAYCNVIQIKNKEGLPYEQTIS